MLFEGHNGFITVSYLIFAAGMFGLMVRMFWRARYIDKKLQALSSTDEP